MVLNYRGIIDHTHTTNDGITVHPHRGITVHPHRGITVHPHRGITVHQPCRHRGIIHALAEVGQKKGAGKVKSEDLLVTKGDGQIEAFLFESLF
jgi:hypothetical protein